MNYVDQRVWEEGEGGAGEGLGFRDFESFNLTLLPNNVGAL